MFPRVMMLAGAATSFHRSSLARTVCLASRTDTDQLRDQLDQLHYEASNTRDKANKARQRLLRLSEAAEKLRRQAAISVQTGKENDARDLLFQKKKTMQALEKTKSRIELLDELSTKLIEAISLREQQLVGTVSQDLEIEREDDDTSPVRVMSPPSEKEFLNSSDDQELQDKSHKTYNIPTNDEINNLQDFLQVCDSDLTNGLTGLTSYKDLLDRIDQNLNKIEAEIMTVVKFSSLILENPENVKVQQLMEILDAVGDVRQRIANIMQKKEEMK